MQHRIRNQPAFSSVHQMHEPRHQTGFWQGFTVPLIFLLMVFTVTTLIYYASTNSNSLFEKIHESGQTLSATLVKQPEKTRVQQGSSLVLISKEQNQTKQTKSEPLPIPATTPATTSSKIPDQASAKPASNSEQLEAKDLITHTAVAQTKQTGTDLSFGLQTVAFPNVESWLNTASENSQALEYQPYQFFRPLLQSIRAADGKVKMIPNITCHKYDADFVANRSTQYAGIVAKLSAKYGIDKHLIMAVIAQESCFKYNATSPAGAQGLMQLMPNTADILKIKDAYDPGQNIDGGIRYLVELKKEFNSDELVLAAYNSGPGTVRKTGGVPNYPETSEYIRKVLSFRNSYRAAAEASRNQNSLTPLL